MQEFQRILVIILVLIVGSFTGVLCYSAHVGLDWGGFLSIIATIIVVLYFGVLEKIFDNLKKLKSEDRHSLALVILTLSSTGLLGIWLAIRKIGLNVRILLSQEGYDFSVNLVFAVITFSLSANVCFTLSTALLKKDGEEVTKGLISVLIQVVAIAFIALLPRYADVFLVENIGGFSNLIVLLIFMVVSLTTLLFVRKYLESSK